MYTTRITIEHLVAFSVDGSLVFCCRRRAKEFVLSVPYQHAGLHQSPFDYVSSCYDGRALARNNKAAVCLRSHHTVKNCHMAFDVQGVHKSFERFENVMENLFLSLGAFITHYNKNTLEILVIYYLVRFVHDLPKYHFLEYSRSSRHILPCSICPPFTHRTKSYLAFILSHTFSNVWVLILCIACLILLFHMRKRCRLHRKYYTLHVALQKEIWRSQIG